MPKGYQHVTRDQRSQIYAYKSMELSLRDIAKKLDKHVSTISREIARNTGLRGYRMTIVLVSVVVMQVNVLKSLLTN